MITIDYDGRSYELVPVTTSRRCPCDQCDLNELPCAAIDPDWLCFGDNTDQRALVFKKMPILINEKLTERNE